MFVVSYMYMLSINSDIIGNSCHNPNYYYYLLYYSQKSSNTSNSPQREVKVELCKYNVKYISSIVIPRRALFLLCVIASPAVDL